MNREGLKKWWKRQQENSNDVFYVIGAIMFLVYTAFWMLGAIMSIAAEIAADKGWI